MNQTDATGRHAACAIGLDIGGTKIAGGVVRADGSVLECLPPIASPPTGRDTTTAVLLDAVAGLRARHPEVQALGVGAAGLVDWPDGVIRWAPNNPYQALPLRRLLADATGLPCVVDNDANTAAWAERRLGSEVSFMAFLTIGTGIGGGLITNGELYRGRTGIAAEVGHMIVDPTGGHRCGCGNVGCLEAVASGTALGQYGREAAAADPHGLLATLAGKPAEVTGETVLAAARMADPTALKLFERQGDWLGIGIANLVTLFDFERIVLGGGVAAAGDLLLVPTLTSFHRRVFARPHRRLPDIVPARLEADAGWIGAAILAIDHCDTAAFPALARQ